MIYTVFFSGKGLSWPSQGPKFFEVSTIIILDKGFFRKSFFAAKQARFATIVEKHKGIKVYAGGDDVLAFLPLHTVLQCAHELALTFEKLLESFEAQDKETHPTLSVGIAIIHHLSLLQDALQIARESEKKAKKQPGKNALAITVHKRGGEEDTAAGKWEQLYPWLQQLTHYYYDNDLSAGTPYELREVEQRLSPAQGASLSKILQEVMQIEAMRILRRKLGVPQGKLTKEKETQIMATFMQRLSIQQDSTGTMTVTDFVKLSDIIHELLVAKLLAEALKEAGMQPETAMTEEREDA